MKKASVLKKALDNGYIIEYGKRRGLCPLYIGRDGKKRYPIIKGEGGRPEMGYNIIAFGDFGKTYVDGSLNQIHDKCFSWAEVVQFVNEL